MALFKNMAITNKGMALYAKAQAGQEIHFTKMQVGSGQIETQNPAALLGLLDPKLDVPITSITANSELKSATIIGNITNDNVTEATYICELGLFAQDPDEGEILYGYVSAGTYGDYYAPVAQGPYNWQYELNAAVGNAANVTAELSPLQWDYGVMNSNTAFIHLSGGNQKEINKSIDTKFESFTSQMTEKVPQTDFTNHTGNTTDAHGINTKSPLRITNATIASNTTLALDNANKRIIVNSASATTITIPLNSTVAFTVGDEIEIVAYGIGKVTIAGEVGTTIRSRNNYKSIDGQYGAISLLKIATDEWLIIGALTA